jgi:uncharacterized iron-regulated membrane protein
MSKNNWQWNNSWAWKPRNRTFWNGYNRSKNYEAKKRRRSRLDKLVGFFWGLLWCVQIMITVAAVRIILADHDVVVTRAATIGR